MKPELSRSWAGRYFRRPPHDIPDREQRPAGGGQMRFGRAADVEVQPSTNGHPQVRLRSPDEITAARPPAWRRLTQPLPLIGFVLVLATFQNGTGAQARAIARGLRVLTVGRAPAGLDTATASVPVTVAVPDP